MPKIPEPLKADFASTMTALFSRSPSAQMCVYLEANRIISTPPDPDDIQITPMTIMHESLTAQPPS